MTSKFNNFNTTEFDLQRLLGILTHEYQDLTDLSLRLSLSVPQVLTLVALLDRRKLATCTVVVSHQCYPGTFLPVGQESFGSLPVLPDICPFCNSSINPQDVKRVTRVAKYQDQTHHSLKIWKQYFQQVVFGNKTFELRKDDRGFKLGDTVDLVEVDESNKLEPTGRVLKVRITYILRGGEGISSCLDSDYVIMSFRIL
jgi:hypothetical protein